MNTRGCANLIVFALLFFQSSGLSASEEPLELVYEVVRKSYSGIDHERLSELFEQKREVMSRHRIVRIDSEALHTDHRSIPPESGEDFDWCIGERVTITIFGNETIVLLNRSVDNHGPMNDFHDFWSWAGFVDGDDASSAGFVVANYKILSGFVYSSIVGYYQIVHINDDYYLAYEENRARFHNMDRKNLEDATDDFEPAPESRSQEEQVIDPEDSSIQGPIAQSSSSSIVQVNAFATASYPGGVTQALSDLTAGVLLANNSLVSSGSSQMFDVIGPVYQVFTVDEGSPKSIVTLHNNIKNDQHEAVTELRDAAIADIMIGFGDRDTDVCGRTQGPSKQGNAERGYLTVAPEAIDCESAIVTVAHELGHVMGGGHVTQRGTWWYAKAFATSSPPLERTMVAAEFPMYARVDRYSSKGTPYGDTSHDNVRAFENLLTAISEYREDPSTLPTPNLSSFSMLVECYVATIDWDDSDPLASEYNVYLDSQLKFRGGNEIVKLVTQESGNHIVEVKACLGNKCDPSPPLQVWFIPPGCIPE